MRLLPDSVLATITIWQEARGESQAGRIAIGEVILNRMKYRYSSDGSLPGTVLYPLQFSGWNVHDPNRIPSVRLDDADPLVQACYAAWLKALQGSDTTHGAVLYYHPEIVTVPPPWASPRVSRRTAIIGAHHFFRPLSL